MTAVRMLMFALLGMLLVLHYVRQRVEEDIAEEAPKRKAKQHMHEAVSSLTVHHRVHQIDKKDGHHRDKEC